MKKKFQQYINLLNTIYIDIENEEPFTILYLSVKYYYLLNTFLSCAEFESKFIQSFIGNGYRQHQHIISISSKRSFLYI